ncbi:23S rRNA pseudouridine(2604) synthase RluF [Aliidiomarina quisquiliarum]|uniref:23S rRNA pseudouridine(2604) synthase RluF n=1 Tax=Aliidiomarina quisquiliarum TaxID=2938947 RepID=UPI00208DE14A|nr:23S rRNA pseudouridine(2604) synthase RluF [Aliidiomarina quisquiliarum]MCO4320539.1 23S rRNA pseudouridine(2604) synthase RluF [Aliidiomarina quisquiliarum]
MSDVPLTRLNKFISESGFCSRREADGYIETGQVELNGKRAVVGEKVGPGDVVKVNGKLIKPTAKDNFVFIALNKPVGIVSTTDSAEKANLVDFVKHKERIFPVGRLDKDSQGLLFMTSNGDLVNRILRAGNNHEKEYIVTVDKPITDEFIHGMGNGVPILGLVTNKCEVTQLSRFVFRIILVQGLNRQIRRMTEHFGFTVKKLERIRIMHVSLGDLPVGKWRDLSKDELDTLLKAIEHSSSEAPPGHRRRQPKTKQKKAVQRRTRTRTMASSARPSRRR